MLGQSGDSSFKSREKMKNEKSVRQLHRNVVHKLRYDKFAWFIFNKRIFLPFLIEEHIFYVSKEDYYFISVLYLIEEYLFIYIKIKYVIITII